MTDPQPFELVKLACEAYRMRPTIVVGDLEILRRRRTGVAIYSVRGTTFDGHDLWRDAEGWGVDDPDLGLCHGGFINAVNAAWPTVRRSLIEDSDAGRRPYWDGHSKGAAEACLFAAKSILEGFEMGGLVGIGCPRPGGSALRRILRPYRVVMFYRYPDFVMDHPWECRGFRHVRKPRKIGALPWWQRYSAHKSAGYKLDVGELVRGGSSLAAWS